MNYLTPHTPGAHLHTRHLRGGIATAIDQIIFSPDETKLACVGYRNEAIAVWDLVKEAPCLQLEGKVGGAMVAFGSVGSLVATCGRGGVKIWDCLAGNLICRSDLPEDVPFVRPALCDLSSPGEDLAVVIGNHLLAYEPSSCKLGLSLRFSEEEDILVHRLDRHAGNITLYFSEYSTGSAAFRIVDVITKHTQLSISLEADDYPLLSSSGHFAVIVRKQQRKAEVWDLFGASLLHELDMPSKWQSVSFGSNGDFLAVSYSHPSEFGQASPNLYIWDLRSGICIQQLVIPFSDILWSERSGLLAMTDLSERNRLPENSLTLFFNPFDGIIHGNASSHRGHTPETFCFSQSGRWFASLFTFDYSTPGGTNISAGTVAITDLTSILPPPHTSTPLSKPK